MAGFKRIFFWTAGWIGGGIALLLILVLLLPYLINLDPLQEKILASISDKLGGQVQYQRLDLSFFPRPRVKILEGRVSIPRTLTAAVTALTVYPEVIPLFKGKVRLSKLVIESPDVRLEGGTGPKKRGTEREPSPPTPLEDEVNAVLAFALKEFPGLTVDVKRGKAELGGKDKSVIRIEDIDARVNFPPGNFTAEVGCRSNLWESLELNVELNPKTFEGDGRVVLTSFNTVPVAEVFLRHGTPKITESKVDLDLQLKAKGLKNIRGEVVASVPNLVLQYPQEKIALKGDSVKGIFSMEDEKITFSLTELDLVNPQMRVAGKLRIEPGTPYAEVEVEARDVDVGSARKVMLAMAGKNPTFQTIFDFVRGGNIPRISVKLWGNSIADLGGTEKILVQGTMAGGDVVVPETVAKFLPGNINLKDVKADVLISKGMLEGKNIEATWENEKVRNVQLRIGLEGKDAPFHVEGDSELDLSQLSPVARRLFKDEAVLQEVDRIAEIRGRAQGRFVVGESLQAITAKADVQEISLVARFGPVPYSLAIDSGQVLYEDRKIGVAGLKGSIGKSSFSGLTGHVEVKERAYLEVKEGTVSVSLDEVYSWLSSYEQIQQDLEDIRSLEGTVSLAILDLKGPLSSPEEWEFRVTGEVDKLSAGISGIPGPAAIEKARFEADAQRISFNDAQVTVFDTGFDVSGSVAGYLKKWIQLELLTQVDLAKLPPILKHFVKDESFQKELALIDGLSGKATTKLTLEVSPGKKKGRVEASDVILSAQYRRVPMGLEIAGGEISYGENGIGLKNISGRMGNSSFAHLTGGLDLGKGPALEIQAGKGAFDLGEIYAWLTSFETLRGVLKDVETVNGNASLSEMTLKGTLAMPREWQFEAVGGFENVEATTRFVPGPVSISTGTFKADQNDLYLSDFQARVLDASFHFGGTLYGYLKGLEKMEMALSGELTPGDIHRISKTLGIKGSEYLKPPMNISGARLSWNKNHEVTFNGNVTVKNGPRIALDILQNRDAVKINRLFIEDEVSRATISMDLRGRVLDVAFAGTLSERTLDKIFSGYQFQDGWMKGDLRVHVVTQEPIQSSAEGKLEVKSLSFPWQFPKRLDIDSASLGAMGKQVKLDSADIRYGGKLFSITGDVKAAKEKLALDLDLFTENLDISEVMEALNDKSGETKKAADLSALPVQGAVRFKTDSLRYDRFAWTPFRAKISLAPEGVRVDVLEADQCGISTPGTLIFFPGGISFDFQPLSKNQDLHPTLTCLSHEQYRMNGKFDLCGCVQGQGKKEGLLRLLRGDLDLTARKGRIYRATGLAKMFAVLNVGGILQGKLPDFRQAGLPYDSISVKVTLGDGKVRIQEATLQGPTVNIASYGELDAINREIDMTVLVAPFETIDSVINKIPVVRSILGSTLVVVPVRVKGSLEDPTVIPLSPTAVGSEVLGIMKRTLKLPVKLVHPFLRK
jgi:hypothetical protein